jgi:hypothetical protein
MKILLMPIILVMAVSGIALAVDGGGTGRCETSYEGGVSCGGQSSRCVTTYEGGVSCGRLLFRLLIQK